MGGGGSDKMTGLSGQNQAKINGGTYEGDNNSDLEKNNTFDNEKTNEPKMQCPICGTRMRPQGKARIWDFLTNKEKYVVIYYCPKCGYKSHWF